MKKKKTGESRREFLKKSLVVVPAVTLGGVALNSMSAFAAQDNTTAKESKAQSPRDYKPVFF